jgi:tetrapyrrole methylase family protein/MazG family protein
MRQRMVVVGLGPGSPEQVTREAWAVLQAARVLYLRTGDHPLVQHLPPRLRVCPLVEEGAHGLSLAQVQEQVVDRLLAAPEDEVVYGVPGHPLVAEATTRLLLERLGRERVRIIAGLSFLEPVCTALGLDPLEQGLQLRDALDLAAPDSAFDPAAPLDPTRPLLVAQLCGRPATSGARQALLQHYPDQHPVTLVQAPGVPGVERVWPGLLVDLDRSDLPALPGVLYVPPLPRLQAQREAATLEWVCARLRGPGGCPWDQEQDHASLRNNLLEEAYETLEALDAGDLGRLCEELGDLLMQVYLHAQLAREEGAFVMADVVAGITAKLIRRHPHVFGPLQVSGSGEVLRNWETIKAAERVEEGKDDDSLLAGVPRTLPALAYAQAAGGRAARVGFDWARVEDVWAKVEEEMAELRQATTAEERSEEVGDILFALVNLARWLDVEAEDALRATNMKFRQRFACIEEEARRRGILLQQMEMAEMDALWEAAKQRKGLPGRDRGMAG